MARYVLPDDLEAATNGVDFMTGLPVEVRVKSTGHRMCLIRPGTFEMGSDFEDEAPIHIVFVSAAYLSKGAVSNAELEQWKPSHRAHRGTYSPRDASPATHVDWNEAVAYCDYVSTNSDVAKGTYRLPSEAEAEAAGRGGLQCRYPWGNDMDMAEKALHASSDGTVDANVGCENSWGFRQMTCGVFFWLHDYYDLSYYSPQTPGNQINPMGPWNATSHRGLRGGTWYVYNMSFRCADRWKALPSTSDDHVGLRILRTLPVPADLPMWTGRPPVGTQTTGRVVARVAALNAEPTSFCIEEAYRAVQARAAAVGYGFTWPNNGAGAAPAYPPDGFYCEDLANDPVPGTVASNLVQRLSAALADVSFLNRFVEERGDVLESLRPNDFPAVDPINTTNYLAQFHLLTTFIPRLKSKTIIGSFSNRLMGFAGIFRLASCDAVKMALDAGWNPDTNSWSHDIGPVGVSAVVIGKRDFLPVPPPPHFVEMWDGHMESVSGYVSADMNAYPAGSSNHVYLAAGFPYYPGLGPNELPAPLTEDGKLHSWDTAIGGTSWVSTKIIGGQKPVFGSECPIPVSGLGAPFIWGWRALNNIVVPVVVTNNYEASCTGCKSAKVEFTKPQDLTKMTMCEGDSTNLECRVTMAASSTPVTIGTMHWELSDPSLGSFSVNDVPLDSDGRARTTLVAAMGSAAVTTLASPGGDPDKIIVIAQNLKDPGNPSQSVPDAKKDAELELTPLEKVPLGKSKSMDHEACFKVYVPTKFGGKLKVTTTSGTITSLKYPDGTAYDNDTETGKDKQGWFTFKVTGSNNYSVSTSFEQKAEIQPRPWNFYWWSEQGDYIREPRNGGNGKADSKAVGKDDRQVAPVAGAVAAGGHVITCGPDGILQSKANTADPKNGDDELHTLINLFDVDGKFRPLQKYDAHHPVKGSPNAAREWEANDSDQKDVAGTNGEAGGHCFGASVASIFLKQPKGNGYGNDELEGLWAELGDNDDNLKPENLGEGVGPIPAVIPGSATDDDSADKFAADFHRILEKHLKGEGKALIANLRANPNKQGLILPDQVWNHAVYKFSAQFVDAGTGDEKAVKITNVVWANDDSPPPTDGNDDRRMVYIYLIIYKNNGEPDTDKDALHDWIAVAGDAKWTPASLGKPKSPIWKARNPHVTEDNVRKDDDAN